MMGEMKLVPVYVDPPDRFPDGFGGFGSKKARDTILEFVAKHLG